MKTLMVPIANSFFVRNFMRADVFKVLKDSKDLRMVFLAPEEKIEYYKSEFAYPNVFFEKLPALRDLASERFFRFLESSSIHTNTVTMLERWQFLRAAHPSFFPRLVIYLISRLFWHLGRFYWWRAMIRKFYFSLASNFFGGFFDKWRPDLVFAANMIYAEDHLVLREAKKRGIKTLGMALSWDNLYSKSLIRVSPDHLVVHTDTIRDQTIALGDYPPGKITVTGIPQYDDYFLKNRLANRDEFIRSIGGDPAKKLIVYAFSGKAGLHIDFDIVKIIHGFVKDGKVTESVNVFLRPYPRYDFPEEKLKWIYRELGFLGLPPLKHVGPSKDSWEFDEESLDLLANTLAHADLVITMYSTFFIEAAIFDKPLIAIAFDGFKKLDYWNSAERFFEWDHLKEIGELGGIWRVKSKEELLEAINFYLANPGHLEDGRKKIVLRQTQFRDGQSAKRVADAILKFL